MCRVHEEPGAEDGSDPPRAGYKLTPQRLAIVRTFADDPTHPTAQELHARLEGSHPGLSVATVYNTLETLSRAGLCKAVTVSGGAARFDPETEWHDHLVCDRCGAVRDHPSEESPGETRKLRGFVVTRVERVLRGVCAKCAKAARPTRA